MTGFVETSPTADAYWRSIILFGSNSATYKFALGKALLELAAGDQTFISLEDLAKPYTRSLVEHLRRTDRQGTAASSQFLNACRNFTRGEITEGELVDKTVRLGFANVLDAFHMVNQDETPMRFFVDERRARKGVVLTDELLALGETLQYDNLGHEVEARWRLVETAWSLDVSPSLLVAEYDWLAGALYVEESTGVRRISVTSCRDALNGYQKGRCFYCSSEISVTAMDIASKSGEPCEVDHFFRHALVRFLPARRVKLDGVWNLVLSCQTCNRGKDGKAARVPKIQYLERLSRRNEYLIWSHHPLRETLILQTGATPGKRRDFLQSMDAFAIQRLLIRWGPAEELRAVI